MRPPITTVLRVTLGAMILAAGAATQAGAADGSPSRLLMLAQMQDDDGNGAVDPQGSAAAMTVRIDRMESTIRSLTGQVEELQFQNKKLADDLRKMQQDVDFRFQDIGRGTGSGAAPARPAPSLQKRTDLDGSVPTTDLPSNVAGTSALPSGSPDVGMRPTRRAGDAFDPDSNPTAPGAPRPLGASTPATPITSRRDTAGGAVTLNNAPSAPLDLMKRQSTPSIIDQSTENGVASVPTGSPADVNPVRPALNPNAMASLAPGGTRDEFNADVDFYKQGQYDTAANGLKSFLDKYPRDRMVPDAVYLLGETYTRLGRHREAAEQYLRLSTDFSKAPRAPDALLRLGMSLNAMGVREQACATYQEVTRRFPTASSDVRAGVDRELKRARC